MNKVEDTNWRMKKPSCLLFLVIFTIVSLSVVKVIIANGFSTAGLDLEKMNKELREYKRQNSLLHEELLVRSSFLNVASKAAQLGFVEEKSRMFLSLPLPIAVKP